MANEETPQRRGQYIYAKARSSVNSAFYLTVRLKLILKLRPLHDTLRFTVLERITRRNALNEPASVV